MKHPRGLGAALLAIGGSVCLLAAGCADDVLSQIGDTCDRDNQCTTGRCDELLCKSGEPAERGEPCLHPLQCFSENCVVEASGGTCGPGTRLIGTGCTEAAQCVSERCIDNRCVAVEIGGDASMDTIPFSDLALDAGALDSSRDVGVADGAPDAGAADSAQDAGVVDSAPVADASPQDSVGSADLPATSADLGQQLPPIPTACEWLRIDIGQPSSTYQTVFDAHNAAYRDPLWMDTFAYAGTEYLSFIWAPDSMNVVRNWKVWWGNKRVDHANTIDTTSLHIVNLTMRFYGNTARYAGLMHYPTTNDVHAEEQREADYLADLATMSGYRPLAISYGELRGNMLVTSAHYYSTVYIGTVVTGEHLTFADFVTFNAAQNAKGLYPVQLSVYTRNGQNVLSGIWKSIAYTRVDFQYGLTRTEMRAAITANCDQGLPLRLVVGYEEAGAMLFVGFWAQ